MVFCHTFVVSQWSIYESIGVVIQSLVVIFDIGIGYSLTLFSWLCDLPTCASLQCVLWRKLWQASTSASRLALVVFFLKRLAFRTAKFCRLRSFQTSGPLQRALLSSPPLKFGVFGLMPTFALLQCVGERFIGVRKGKNGGMRRAGSSVLDTRFQMLRKAAKSCEKLQKSSKSCGKMPKATFFEGPVKGSLDEPRHR